MPVLALLASVFLWGGSFSAMRVILTEVDPWAVMWIRMALASAAVLPFFRTLDFSPYQKGDWKLLVPMVLFQPCLYFLLEANALKLTTSSQAGVISAAVPLLVSLGAWLFLSETLTIKTWAGLAASIIGVAVLTLAADEGGRGSNALLGNLMELGAMVSAAANMLIIKELSKRFHPFTLTALQCFGGTLFFFPGLRDLVQTGNLDTLFSHWGLFLYLGVFVSLGAFGLYNWGMSSIQASRASTFINLVPVTAVLLGSTLLGETLNGKQTGAAVLVIGGVWLSQSRLSFFRWKQIRRNG